MGTALLGASSTEMMQGFPLHVSFSHLSKHRLINALAVEINETGILVKTHRRAYR
jgi:hypothetical protein